jgi:hypothetical protein
MFNSFVFFKRQSSDVLYISRMISNTSIIPTILKLLYYISYLYTQDTNSHLEVDLEDSAMHLKKVLKIADKALQILNLDNISTKITTLHLIIFSEASY